MRLRLCRSALWLKPAVDQLLKFQRVLFPNPDDLNVSGFVQTSCDLFRLATSTTDVSLIGFQDGDE